MCFNLTPSSDTSDCQRKEEFNNEMQPSALGLNVTRSFHMIYDSQLLRMSSYIVERLKIHVIVPVLFIEQSQQWCTLILITLQCPNIYIQFICLISCLSVSLSHFSSFSNCDSFMQIREITQLNAVRIPLKPVNNLCSAKLKFFLNHIFSMMAVT